MPSVSTGDLRVIEKGSVLKQGQQIPVMERIFLCLRSLYDFPLPLCLTALSPRSPDTVHLILIPSFEEQAISSVAYPPACHHTQEF